MRVAVVTGGTRGIGEATSLALSGRGLRVAATFVHGEERAAAFTSRTGIRAFRWDVCSLASCQAGLAAVEEELGPVDIIVNNAGITRDSSLLKMTEAQWQDVIDTNLTGCFNMAKAGFPGMKDRGWGRIVNVGSINGQAGQFGQANYAAAKAGLQGLTKALALEGARSGITVNMIAPGYVETEMVGAMSPDALAKVAARIPVGRLGQPAEIARGVAFLVADDAAFITGATLSINGGQHMA